MPTIAEISLDLVKETTDFLTLGFVGKETSRLSRNKNKGEDEEDKEHIATLLDVDKGMDIKAMAQVADIPPLTLASPPHPMSLIAKIPFRFSRMTARLPTQIALDKRLEHRRESRPSMISAFGGTKKGWLVRVEADLLKSHCVYGVLKETGELHIFEDDTSMAEIAVYHLNVAKRTVKCTVTNVGLMEYRSMKFFLFEMTGAVPQAAKAMTKKEAKQFVKKWNGVTIRFAASDPDVLDDWIDAILDVGVRMIKPERGGEMVKVQRCD